MRNSLFYLFILFAALSGASSCATDREDGAYLSKFSFRTEDLNQSGGLVYTRIADSTNAMHVEFYGNPIQQDYLFIDFNKTDFTTPGTYAVGYNRDSHSTLKMTYYTNASHEYTSTTGTLTITKVDTRNKLITGTFQFTGVYGSDVKRISYGQFYNLSYGQQYR